MRTQIQWYVGQRYLDRSETIDLVCHVHPLQTYGSTCTHTFKVSFSLCGALEFACCHINLINKRVRVYRTPTESRIISETHLRTKLDHR